MDKDFTDYTRLVLALSVRLGVLHPQPSAPRQGPRGPASTCPLTQPPLTPPERSHGPRAGIMPPS